jgi:sirohydrochlorin ferrochelatase
MEKIAVLLIGHGSSVDGASQGMHEVVETIRAKGIYEIVEVGFMVRNQPTIEEAVDTCVSLGATTIVAIPYFLHAGMHITHDIPEILHTVGLRYPILKLHFGKSLGFHPKIAEVVLDRVQEAKAQAESVEHGSR